MSTQTVGRHFLFPQVSLDATATHSYLPEVHWLREAADEAERRYKDKGIAVRRLDFPDVVRDGPTDGKSLEILTELNDAQRDIYASFLKLLSAERRWQKWLRERRPSEPK